MNKKIEKSGLCKYCTDHLPNNSNLEHCAYESCDGKYFFTPIDRVKKYFKVSNQYEDSNTKQQYIFDACNETLESTFSVRIGNTRYCPYCGDEMRTIDVLGYNYDPDAPRGFSAIRGFCCICEGAEAEIEYKKEVRAIRDNYEEAMTKEISLLTELCEHKISFDMDKLLKIKQDKELANFNKSYGRDDSPLPNVSCFPSSEDCIDIEDLL